MVLVSLVKSSRWLFSDDPTSMPNAAWIWMPRIARSRRCCTLSHSRMGQAISSLFVVRLLLGRTQALSRRRETDQIEPGLVLVVGSYLDRCAGRDRLRTYVSLGEGSLDGGSKGGILSLYLNILVQLGETADQAISELRFDRRWSSFTTQRRRGREGGS